MTVLRETIRVKRPAAEAFAYVADFTTTTEWDSTAKKARKLTPGPVERGTRFLVTCAMPLGTIDIEYEVAELDPPNKIVLRGNSRFFDIKDTITFTESGTTTQIVYQAQFHFGPVIKSLAGAMEPGLKRMGKASVKGLKEALDDKFPAPKLTGKDATADKLVLPKLARFTRLGYRRGRKHWNPVSADMRGKHVVITGSSTGLGFASAMELARRGADLTLVMRNKARAEEVKREIAAETGNGSIALEMADLSLLAEVDALVARLKDRGQPIDVLINNAGALYNEWQATSEGIERSVALLLLSPFRLTLGLKPLLAAADEARVINVVSGGMYSQKLSVKRLVSKEDEEFSGATAYARAKRALMVVTRHWARAWRKEGIVVNAMHPGWADTPGVKTSLPTFHALTRLVLRSPDEGADTIVWLAAATEAGKLSGQLLLDREPQTQYLLKDTRETAAERKKLFSFLDAYVPAAHDDAAPLPTAKAS